MRIRTFEKLKALHESRNGFKPEMANDQSIKPLTESQAQRIAKKLGLPPLVHVGNGMWACVHDITPHQGLSWLSSHNNQNRDDRFGRISRMQRDMEHGKWLLTHQAIAFDENGEFVDGQHRVSAGVASGCVFRAMIVVYAGRVAAHGIDTNMTPRDLKDVVDVSGEDPISRDFQSTLKLMYQGPSGIKSAPEIWELTEAIKVFGEAVAWALEHMTSTKVGVKRASVWAAIARAYFHSPKTKLAEFCEVLSRGMGDKQRPEDATIITLMNYLATKAGKPSGKDRVEVYLKTLVAIHHYINGVAVTKLYISSADDLFPLPEFSV